MQAPALVRNATPLTSRPQSDALGESSLHSPRAVLAEVVGESIVLDLLQPANVDLGFKRVASDERVEFGVVLRLENGELLVVAVDLGLERSSDACWAEEGQRRVVE
jgi:hypothetical protein